MDHTSLTFQKLRAKTNVEAYVFWMTDLNFEQFVDKKVHY